MRQIVITFGLIVLCSLILFQTGKYAFFKNSLSIELIIGIFAGIFLIVGLLIAGRINTSPAQVQHPPVANPEPKAEPKNSETDQKGQEIVQPQPEINQAKIEELGISKREYDVLLEIASGLSNLEIANKLFVSESTVKTHISNLLSKLNAKRRTEAVRIAKELKIIK